MRGLPSQRLAQLLRNRPELVAAGSNAAWLIADKILRTIVGIFVFAWIARHLGPQDFGVLNWVLALAAMLTVITPLGMDGILARELVRSPDLAPELLGTTAALQLISGLCAMVVMCIIGVWLAEDDRHLQHMVIIGSLLPALRAAEVVKYAFEAKVQSRYPVAVEAGVFLAMAITRIVLVLGSHNLTAFVIAAVMEAGLIALGLAVLCQLSPLTGEPWRATKKQAKWLLRESWPLLISAAAVVIYMRTDQLMLAELGSHTELGFYSAAIRVSETAYVLPMILVASTFPSILKLRETNSPLYSKRMQELLDVLGVLSLVVASTLGLLAPVVIQTIYGGEFEKATRILQIHAWGSLFVFLGVAGSRWYIAEGLQKLSASRTLIGAGINVALNWILIPMHGGMGAAIATVISFCFAGFLLDAVNTATRPIFLQKSAALLVFFRVAHRYLAKLR